MNDPANHELRELSWRRKLNPQEEARLRADLAQDAEALAQWEDEARLTRLLEQLPEAPAASTNFTSRLLQTIEREQAAAGRAETRPQPLWRRCLHWLPRLGMVCAVFGIGVMSYQHHVASNERAMANSVAKVYRTVAADPEIMEDFDSIRWMGDLQPKADTELLALLQ